MKRILSGACVVLMAATAPSFALEVTIQDEEFSYTTKIPDGAEASTVHNDSKFFYYNQGKQSNLRVWLTTWRATSCEDAREELYGDDDTMLNYYGANECAITHEDDGDIEINYLMLHDGPAMAMVEFDFEKESFEEYKDIIEEITTNLKQSVGYSLDGE